MPYESLIETVTQYRSPSKALENKSFSRTVLGGGSGSSRLVFKIDTTTVVKIATSEMGVTQNNQEHTVWKHATAKAKKHLAEVYRIGGDGYWLEMRRVNQPEETYKAIATDNEQQVKDWLENEGIIVPEIEVGVVDGTLVAYDYGACEI